jgi:pyridinium-3,5-biscarboxylic acid mononucleotide sulfurtransferase
MSTSPPRSGTDRLPSSVLRRLGGLLRILQGFDNAIVAYSGGVDSTVLAWAASQVLGDGAVACIAVSPSLAASELAAAQETAEAIGIALRLVRTDEVEREDYARNLPSRCYVCKGALFARLADLARTEGFRQVLYGANADDGSDYRPGARAAVEAGVRAPLAEAGLTKDDVRAIARVYGLPNWDKPASPCLASRIPYGQRVTVDKLRQVEEGEQLLHRLGFREARVRHHGDIARIEVSRDELSRVVAPEMADEISQSLRRLGFTHVAVDLLGFRSGSLNEGLARALPVPPAFPPPNELSTLDSRRSGPTP